MTNFQFTIFRVFWTTWMPCIILLTMLCTKQDLEVLRFVVIQITLMEALPCIITLSGLVCIQL